MNNNIYMDVLPVIPGYKFTKLLGHGGAADVWLGVQEVLGRNVAIKILRQEDTTDPSANKRFLREGETAAKLVHPNILTIIDVGYTGQYYYMVMEYLPGNLREFILSEPGKKLPPSKAVEILAKIARALSYAHGEAVVHRDIKPDNILMRRNGEPVIADFGIARNFGNRKGLTSTGVIIGTPDYMSPEQCRGQAISGKSDFYSLGVVFYEMLTGTIPYKADSAAGVLIQHMDSPVPVLEGELSVYQPLLNALMAKDPDERPDNPADFEKLMSQPSMTVALGDQGMTTLTTPTPEEPAVKNSDTWVFGENGRSPETDTIDELVLQEPSDKKRGRNSWILIPSILLMISGGVFLYKYFSDPEKESAPDSGKPGIVEVEDKIPATVNSDKKEEKKKSEPEDTKRTEYNNLIRRAQSAMADQDFNTAGELAQKAGKLYQTAEVERILTLVQERLRALKDREFNHHFQIAENYFKESNLDEALKALLKAENVRKSGRTAKLRKDIENRRKVLVMNKTRKDKAAAEEKRAFQRAVAGNTVYGYEKFLKKYPSGKYSDTALKRISQLKQSSSIEHKIREDLMYKEAMESDTIESCEKYLKSFPGGRYVAEVKKELASVKQKIVKETKIPLEVMRVEFLNAPSPNGKDGKVIGKSGIRQMEAHYIFTRLYLKNRLYNIGDSENNIKIVYINKTEGIDYQITGRIVQDSFSKTSTYSRGIGWSEGGKWQKGDYSVEIYINSRRISGGTFIIN